ncbi:MAG: YaiI/YqxD family protein, partial [Hypericibacter sp.]
MLEIFVDADACPVKQEVYASAKRLNLIVHVVANQWMTMPNDPLIRLEVVDDGFDAADNWIVEHAGSADVVVTDDILLAGRCIAKGARVITNRGVLRDAGNIGEALA